MDGVRPCTLLEELDIEGCMVEHRRGELYRLAAKRIRELEAVRPEVAATKWRQVTTVDDAEFIGPDGTMWRYLPSPQKE